MGRRTRERGKGGLGAGGPGDSGRRARGRERGCGQAHSRVCVRMYACMREGVLVCVGRYTAEFEGDGISVVLYGFEAEPLSAIHAEVRGEGNPVPVLAALCRPQGWGAVDDASGQPIEMT